jgi:hypothetical protein
MLQVRGGVKETDGKKGMVVCQEVTVRAGLHGVREVYLIPRDTPIREAVNNIISRGLVFLLVMVLSIAGYPLLYVGLVDWLLWAPEHAQATPVTRMQKEPMD